MTRAFISYSHADDALRAEFDKHLSLLRRQGLIDVWSDHRIPAGGDFEKHISAELEAANVIMLLVSPDFMASDYCFGIEMTRAMERHLERSAIVVPVILRPVDWKSAPFGALKALPRDGKAVVKWSSLDDAFLDVVQALRKLLDKSTPPPRVPVATAPPLAGSEASPKAKARPRSGTLSLAHEFTDMDRDNFVDEGFSYIQSFFENSLHDIGERNPGIEGKIRRISAIAFTATLYRNGGKVAGCYVRISNGMGSRNRSIGYSSNDSTQDNSYNEFLSVEADSYNLHLRATLSNWSGQSTNLTFEGASEKLWQLFIERLT